MKKLIFMAIMGTMLFNACSGIGINIGTSIIPGVYIGTSTTIDKDDLKLKKTETKAEASKEVEQVKQN